MLSHFVTSVRLDRLIAAMLCALALQAISCAQDDERVISPDRRYAVTPIEVKRAGMDADSYAIQLRRTGKTLAICPDDDRFSSHMGTVKWSPDSQFVSISTHTSRHGGLLDLWRMDPSKATRLSVDFSQEETGASMLSPSAGAMREHWKVTSSANLQESIADFTQTIRG